MKERSLPVIGRRVVCLLLIDPVGVELESSAEGADVGADGVELCCPSSARSMSLMRGWEIRMARATCC